MRNIFTNYIYFVYSSNFQVRTQKRLVEENCQSSRENSLQEASSPEAEEFLILPRWSTAADGTALWSPGCENIHKMWNWALDSCKKNIYQFDCKNALQKQQQPCPTSRYQNIVNLHFWARTTLLLPVWINEHHTLGKLLLSQHKTYYLHIIIGSTDTSSTWAQQRNNN